MRKIKALILLLLLSLVFVLPIYARGGLNFYGTDGGVTYSQQNEITEKIEWASEYTGVDFYVWYYCGSRYEHQPTDRGGDEIYLVILESYSGGYYYDLYTYGTAYTRLSDADVDYILDHEDVYDNLKAGRIYEGIIGFLNVAAQELGTPAAHNARAITVAAVISLLIGGIAATVVVVKYKRKLKSPSYPLERYARLSVTHASDKFLTRNVTRVKIQSSSSGGRSGGGGGGHRGGR